MPTDDRWSDRVRRWVRGRSQEASAVSLMHLGLTYAAAVVLYGLGGWWLDGRLGTLPLFTLLGVFLGAFAGFLWIYREVQRAEDRERRRRRDAPRPPGAPPPARDDDSATEPEEPRA